MTRPLPMGLWYKRLWRLAWRRSLCGCVALCAACQPYRIETRTRPAFYNKAVAGDLPEQVVLDDGTIVRYRTPSYHSTLGRPGAEAGKPLEIRQQHEDGTITLRALLPEHVIMNALICLKEQEYQLMWDQLLCERVKQDYQENGQGWEDFAQFMQKNRQDLASTLARMISGLAGQDVKFEHLGDGITRCSLRPQIASPFKFTAIEVAKDGPGLKLLAIR